MTDSVSTGEVKKRTLVRKVRTGLVSSDKMDKTITVVVKRKKMHPLYGKVISFSKKLTAHDEKNEAQEGDFVEITETRPLSKNKRWRLTNIVEHRK